MISSTTTVLLLALRAAAPAWDDAWLDGAVDGAEAAVEPPRLPRAPPGLDRAVALSLDALPGARPLRRPLPSRPAPEGTLDATHERAKARAVLAAAAAFAGPERWRAVEASRRAARSAGRDGAAPLLEAIAAAAGDELSGAVRGLLERPGPPLLRAEVRCDAGGARLLLEVSAAPRAAEAGPEAVPACLRAGGPRGEVTVCAVASPRAMVALPFCPAWVWPNAGGAGYHLSPLRPGGAARLLPRLGADERLALAGDAAALARLGLMPLEEALGLVPALARDPDPRVASASLLLLRLAEPEWLAEKERPAWRAFLRRAYGPRARALGWLPRPEEDAGTRQARALLLPLVAGEGEEAVLAGEALALARRWLLERRQVPDEVGWSALEAAARHGDGAFLEELVAAAERAAEPAEQARLWGAAGRLVDPEAQRAALALAAARAPAAGEAALLGSALARREGRDGAWAALRGRWDALAPRLAPAELARLAEAAGRAACEPRRRAEVAADLGGRAAAADGAGRALAFAFDEADACLRARHARPAAVGRLLSGR